VNLKTYDYILPKSNLALTPTVPRDSSRLFVYDTKTDEIVFDHFYNLDRYLPKNSFLVLNNTKVLPARVEMKKENGGKVIILFLVNTPSGREESIQAMADRKINVGEKLFFPNGEFVKAISQDEHIFVLEYSFSKAKLFQILEKYGNMPIPLYLKKTPLKRDELIEKYQTIFARAPVGARFASSAAPTASLHFTDRVFEKLDEKGIKRYFITLHVGLGTFAPLTEENLTEKKLHEEYYEILEESLHYINIMKSKGKKLVAVGTTVTRTLESAYKNFVTRESHRFAVPSKVKNFHTSPPHSVFDKTDLFIFPPYDFKMVDVLITNFHLPKSSLMMLVEAFLQFKKSKRSLVDLYNVAIRENFRFYSFGDAMLIL